MKRLNMRRVRAAASGVRYGPKPPMFVHEEPSRTFVPCRGDCGNPALEAHRCNYQVEVIGNDEYRCNCCQDCIARCNNEI